MTSDVITHTRSNRGMLNDEVRALADPVIAYLQRGATDPETMQAEIRERLLRDVPCDCGDQSCDLGIGAMVAGVVFGVLGARAASAVQITHDAQGRTYIWVNPR